MDINEFFDIWINGHKNDAYKYYKGNRKSYDALELVAELRINTPASTEMIVEILNYFLTKEHKENKRLKRMTV